MDRVHRLFPLVHCLVPAAGCAAPVEFFGGSTGAGMPLSWLFGVPYTAVGGSAQSFAKFAGRPSRSAIAESGSICAPGAASLGFAAWLNCSALM